MSDKLQKGTYQNPRGDRTKESIDKYVKGMRKNRSFEYKKNDRGKIVKIPQMLTGGQTKIASKAPPKDKITEADFAVLRAEKPMKAMTGKAVNRREETRKKQNPHSEYDKKGKLKYTAAKMGKSVRGYGAARTSGSGLMDEQMAPGKVINARVGKDANYAKYLKGLKKASDEVKGSKRKKYSSMEEMRKAKGFRPGETPEGFNKRKAAEKLAKTASRAGTVGKIALGVAAVGMGAKKYLDKKRKEKEEMKKEGSMKSPFIPKKMGGGMMNKPMGYKSGTMVMARGCKLGRKKATKIT